MADNTESTATPQDQSNPFAALAAQQSAPPTAVSPSTPVNSANPFAAVIRAQSQVPAQSPAAVSAVPTNPTTVGGNPFAALAAQNNPQPQPTQPPAQTPQDFEDRFHTGESILTKPLSTYILPEYREGAGPVEKGAEKFATALTSPISLALMLATAGTGSIAAAGAEGVAGAIGAGLEGAEGGEAATFGAKVLSHVAEKYGADAAAQVGKIANVVDKTAAAGFTFDQVRGVAQQIPQVLSDFHAGDSDAAIEHLTQAGLGAVFAAAAVSHLRNTFGLDKLTWVPDKDALGQFQGENERGNLEAERFEKSAKAIGLTDDENLAARMYHEAGGLKNEVEAQPEADRRTTPREENVPDRRQNTELRKKISQMSPDEMRKELLTSQVVDLPNRRAFDEAGPANSVGMSDADGLKAFNDKFGYEAGNELLKAKAEALKQAGIDAYHEKGDEFLYRGSSPEELKEKLENARDILRKTPIRVTMKDGSVKEFQGADFSYGTGKDLNEAESGLKQHKGEREARGERARGELRGITEVEPRSDRESGSPAQEAQQAAPENKALEFPKNTINTLREWEQRIQNMDHLPPAVRERWLNVVRNAQNLRPEVKNLAESLRSEYSKRWQMYKDVGLVHPDAVERPNYAGSTRYEPDDEGRSAFRPSEGFLRATKKPTNLKSRSFDNMIDAMDKGFVPKNIGLVDAYSNYVREHSGAVGIKNAEDIFLKHTDADGRPVAINPASIQFPIEATSPTGKITKPPMVRIMDVSKLSPETIANKVYTDEKGYHYLDVSDYMEGPKVFARNRVADVGFKKDPNTGDVMRDAAGNPVELPIMRKTALMFHPDQIQQVRDAFEDSSWVRKTPWANAVLRTAQGSKSFLLALSPFHYVTEGLRGLQMNLPMHEVFHPRAIDPEGLAMTEGVNHGLTLKSSAERSAYSSGAGEGVGTTGPLFQKIPVLGSIQKAAEDHLFGSYIPRLKAVAFEKIAGQLKEQNPNWDTHQIYAQSARITNGIFGGLNWKQLGVSANTVDILRLVALAPDFTGSQIDSTMSMFKPGGSVVAQSFGRMMMYNFLVAQTMNMLMHHGKPNLETPFSVLGPDGKRSWSMRTMPEDTWRSLTEPQSFFRNRMNPLAKTAYEALYGRDDQGKKLSDEQMVGDAIRNVSPLSLQSAGSFAIHHLMPNQADKFKTGNAEDNFYDSMTRSVGLNPSVNRTPAEKLASQRLSERTPSGTADPSQVKRHHKMLNMEDELRAGHSVDFTGLTPSQARQVKTAGHEELLVSKFGRLNMGDKMDVWRLATSEEKRKLLPGLMKERNSYLRKLSPSERANDETFQRMQAMGLVPQPRQ